MSMFCCLSQTTRMERPCFSRIFFFQSHSSTLSACMPKHLYLYVGTVSQEFLSKLSIPCLWNRQKLPRVPTCNYIHGDIFVPFQTFCLLENTWLGHLFCFHLGVHAWLGSDNGTGRFPFYCWECDHLFENAEIELPKYSPRSFFDLNH